MRNNIEVLSPAGSFEAFLAAVNAGCDAVYLGGRQFSARANAQNFDNEDLKKTIEIAHLNNVKVYFTANTLMKENEFSALYEQIRFLYEVGIDALIIQDIGVYRFVREYFPKLPLHGSTQMTVHNDLGRQFVQELGFERIVLSRECDFQEIEKIIKNTNIDVEVFVHGALCYCYSGQCLMSSMIGGRSGNRGQCAQPCRLQYSAMYKGEFLNQKKEQYLLSPKDIMSLELIPQLVDSGIHSLKIEGRMKSPVYVGLVTHLYRKYVDQYLNNPSTFKIEEKDIVDIMQIYNRGGFTSGYLENAVNSKMLSITKPNHFGVKVGKVTNIKGKHVTIKTNNTINQADYLEITTSKGKKIPLHLKEIINGNEFTLFVKEDGIKVNDIVFRLVANALNEEVTEKYLKIPQIIAQVDFSAMIGQKARVTIKNDLYSITVEGHVIERAKKASVTKEKLLKQLNKTGNSMVKFSQINLSVDDDIFLPISEINRLRRESIDSFTRKIKSPYKRSLEGIKPYTKQKDSHIEIKSIHNISVLIRDKMQFEQVMKYPIQRLYIDYNAFSFEEKESIIKRGNNRNISVYLGLPRILTDELSQIIIKELYQLKGYKGILVRTYDQFQLVKVLHSNVVVDYTLNTFNSHAVNFWKAQSVKAITLSNELNEKEIKQIADCNLELMVYGYLPVMVSKQCLYKNTTNKCAKDNKSMWLKDRKDKELLVQKDCKACLNIIYNTNPTVLLDKIDQLEKSGIQQIRMEFVNESPTLVKAIMDYAFSAKQHKERKEQFLDRFQKGFTRGHFSRGVK